MLDIAALLQPIIYCPLAFPVRVGLVILCTFKLITSVQCIHEKITFYDLILKWDLDRIN